ncbi:hypothetical protein [Massilia antarctica]|uniref:hypothetical protein n=1 Tax=Massilia antarctica TaxID=2765360 RepID=UPI0006BB7B3A|nr:hypothetical protein [Massilia sp. H27-R4]MCY0915658.1 hypothetical protein [Massilia sp. H27-R4]
MKLELMQYTCGTGAHEFLAPEIPGGSYGDFLLRSEASEEMRFLNGIEDATYNEVDALMRENERVQSLPANQPTEVLWKIYGATACDPDSTGSPFIIGLMPKCPVCGGREMASWDYTYPSRFVDADVPVVSHRAWNALSPEQKRLRVEEQLAQFKD